MFASALFLWASPQGPARETTTAPPVIAIVSTNGLLLPMFVWSGSGWTGFGWPTHDNTSGLDDTKLPPIPRSVSAIPEAWIRPLRSFPASWRAELVGVGRRPLRLLAPTAWKSAAVDAVAVGVDYRAAGVEGRMLFQAGIAVSGDVTTLPVRRLTRAAPEWRSIVETHIVAFDRAQRMPWAPGQARSRAALRRWLLRSEVDLWEVTRPEGSFFYFEVSDGTSLTGACPPAQGLEGRIDAPRNGPPGVISIQPVSMSCGDMNEAFEILGAVSYERTMLLVILSGGEGGSGYEIVDPKKPFTWRHF